MTNESPNATPSYHPERNVLGGILLGGDDITARVLDILAPEDFATKAHAAIFRAIKETVAAGKVIHLAVIVDTLRQMNLLDVSGGGLYLAGIEQTTLSIEAAEDCAIAVKRYSDLRRICDASSKIQALAADGSSDPEDLIGRFTKDVSDIVAGRMRSSLLTDQQAVDAAMAELDAVWAGRSNGVDWGIPSLDEALGPMPKGGLIVIAAKTGGGKTTLALELLRNAAKKHTVLLLTLEMSAEEIGMKRLARETAVSTKKATSAFVTEVEKQRLREFASTAFLDSKLLIDDTCETPMERLAARARATMMRHPDLALICVDYLQLVTAARPGSDRVREVSEISRGLKLLARELDVPILALSQFSRKADDKGVKTPQLAFLRESGSIEQDASIVLALWGVDEKPGQQSHAMVEIHVLKSRMAAKGQVLTLAFNKARGSFSEMERSTTKPAASFG